MTTLIKSGLSSKVLEQRRQESYEAMFMKIENIKEMIELYKLTRDEGYDKIKEALKIAKTTKIFVMNSIDKLYLNSLIEYGLDTILRHEAFVIDKDLTAILNYNVEINEAKNKEKLDKENGLDTIIRQHYK